jgi:hypothetical protein
VLVQVGDAGEAATATAAGADGPIRTTGGAQGSTVAERSDRRSMQCGGHGGGDWIPV